jgi:hypothetical protein
MTSRQTLETSLLRVAHPRECNAQQNNQIASNHATRPATGAQQTSLKALALLALGRNNACNTAQQTPENRATNVLRGGEHAQQPVQHPLRGHLIDLAAAEGIDAELIRRLPAEDVEGCQGLSDGVLTAYVRAVRDSDLRECGRVPADETAAAMCRHCGPVFVAPEIASAAPIVDGWPRVLGCSWCHTRNRASIPRPLRSSGDAK